MNEKNPLEPMLAKMVELMEAIQQHKGPLNEISPEFIKEIEQLEQRLNALNTTAQGHLAEVSIDPETIRIDTMLSGQLSDRDKRVFERATRIGRDAKLFKIELDKAIKKGRQKAETKTGSSNTASKEQIKERRKRFKPIGGDKNWIPL